MTLHGNQIATEAAVAAAATTVAAVVRWTNRAVIAHAKAVTEANAAEVVVESKDKGEAEVIIYGRDACGWCSHVAADFAASGIVFRKVDIDEDAGNAEMWQKVQTNPEIGNTIGLPVVDICGHISIRPTAEEVLQIIRHAPATTVTGDTAGKRTCVGDDCSIISHDDGSREGGKPALLTLKSALTLAPVTNHYGIDGPQDERLTVYGAFMEMNCKLHYPTTATCDGCAVSVVFGR